MNKSTAYEVDDRTAVCSTNNCVKAIQKTAVVGIAAAIVADTALWLLLLLLLVVFDEQLRKGNQTASHRKQINVMRLHVLLRMFITLLLILL